MLSRWRGHLGLFDERDVIRCIAEQPLVVRQQSGAGRGSGSHDLDLLVQELAPGDEPERQGASPARPPDHRAVDKVELLDPFGIGLGHRDRVLELIVPARQVAEADGGIAAMGLVDERMFT